MGDLALLLGGFCKFGGAIACEAAFEDGKHFICGFAGGADDVGEAELFFVLRVESGEAREDLFCGGLSGGLFLFRPICELGCGLS